jgi:hypothetical protein
MGKGLLQRARDATAVGNGGPLHRTRDATKSEQVGSPIGKNVTSSSHGGE